MIALQHTLDGPPVTVRPPSPLAEALAHLERASDIIDAQAAVAEKWSPLRARLLNIAWQLDKMTGRAEEYVLNDDLDLRKLVEAE
jgi:hypothetical protein